MNERLRTKAIAVGLGLSTGLGLTACGHADPNTLSSCNPDWVTDSVGTANQVTSMPQTMAALEAARSRMVTDIEQTLGTTDNAIRVSAIPARYRVAASLLIGTTNPSWYDTTQAKLDTPREEFCQDPDVYGIYKTPDYVNAAAALQAAGIPVAAPEEN